jgi:hypothetical protein
MFDKLKSVKIKGQKQGVTRLEIPQHPDSDPKTCTEWRTIEEVPTEIVEQLQKRNQNHFSQARGTPFTIDPLWTHLGFNGNYYHSDRILDGSYSTDNLADPVLILIQHLKISNEMASIQTYPTISLQEFEGKIRAWRESTMTSPSGLHLGHYKALFAKHKYSRVDDSETTDKVVNTQASGETHKEQVNLVELKREFNHMQQSLTHLHLHLMNYALERGYSYTRWQNIANTILFKDQGCVKVHRTRVIHIYEADFNLILGLKWRIALYQSEALKQLNDGQHGSRPRRNAIDPVMIEELQFEISRISRRMLLQTNYDATACYDRIIANVAMLASQRFGVPKSATQSNANTLQQAKFHIRTELGLSPHFYSHTDERPIYGTGQGSGNSPMIWCFLSSLLYDCYDIIESSCFDGIRYGTRSLTKIYCTFDCV